VAHISLVLGNVGFIVQSTASDEPVERHLCEPCAWGSRKEIV